MTPSGTNEARAIILAAEYTALRSELMFFIQMQRQNMTFLLTTAFGQILGLAFVGFEKVDPLLVVYFYLFVAPFLVGMLMLMSLENTAKIIVAASYISGSLRRQIRPLFDTDDGYFLWEHHKRGSTAVNRRLHSALDRSKWMVFVFGLALSVSLAHMVQIQTQAIKHGFLFPERVIVPIWGGSTVLVWDQFLISGGMIVLTGFFLYLASSYFSESKGVIEVASPSAPASTEQVAAVRRTASA